MQIRTLTKTSFFRLLTIALLAMSAGFVVLPESNLYSVDKTFVKSHVPAADNFALILTADDKEDMEEDGTVDAQFSADFFAEFVSFVIFLDRCDANGRPTAKMNNHPTFIFHRQLLI